MASIISLNYVPPLMLSLVVLVSLVAPSTSFSDPSGKLSPAVLKKICLEDGHRPTCWRTLRYDPQARTLTLGNLTRSYVEKARNRASSTLRLLENLIRQTLPAELILKYRACWQQYKVAETELNRAKSRLESNNYEITELVSGARRRSADCDDEFEDRKFNRSPELYKSSEDLETFTDIAYGLADELLFP